MPAELPADTIAARLDELRGGLRVVAEGGREVAAVLTRLDAEVEAAATLAADRSKRLDDVERRLEAIERSLATMAVPVAEHYAGLRKAQELADANRVGLLAMLTPDRIINAGKWIAIVGTALGLGGGMGAHFRGCGGQIVTAADVQPAPDGGSVPKPAGDAP